MNRLEALGKRVLFFDGAMGTQLQEKGLRAGELPELWNLEKPALVESVHRAYLDAGCDIITTNTFGANGVKLKDEGVSVEAAVTAGVEAARRAVEAFLRDNPGTGDRPCVALDISSTGKLLEPLGDLAFEDAYAAYREAAVWGEQAGADLALIETMSDLYEVKAAVLAVRENTKLPVIASLVFDEKGRLLTGGDIPAAVAMLEGLGVLAIGMNCALGPKQLAALFPELESRASVPLLFMPNAGLPKAVEGRTVFDVDPEAFADALSTPALEGAWFLGGCCGTTPAHLAALVRAVGGRIPKALTEKNRTVVSSYARTVEFGGRPVLIGERINPTGKPRFKQALLENDLDYLLREGLAQQESGAHVLDVNVGLPGIDEREMMCRAVTRLQGVTELPLQIDTSDPKTMEAAMRLYNGKPLINSVNGKEQTMAEIFPLVKKYGGVVVALTLDEEGIPPTAEGRLAVAEKIVRRASAYGIAPKDLIADPLVMTISAGQESARIALEAVKLIRERLGIHTVMGLSNISFGLPKREAINAAFFILALQSGLDAAIVNPHSQELKTACDAWMALSGADPQCLGYIAAYGSASSEKDKAASSASSEMTLHKAVVGGLRESAGAAAKELLLSRPPLEVVNGELVPALDQVGRAFETGTMFLPQLLMSAEAARAAFEVIRTRMNEDAGPKGSDGDQGEKIVLATVQGDIHDIGKNIVKVLLENYGFRIIDLGRDVPPEKVVEAVLETGATLVGLSALMTTTVVFMEETIRALRKAAPNCRIMTGGAVLTEPYAHSIGADRYVRDAMASVRYAQELFAEKGGVTCGAETQ